LSHAYPYLQPCIPYLDGCTSISGTGRYPPASFLFKAVEMAMAVALPVFWYFSVKWLRALDPNWHSHAVWSIFLSGAVGALALIIYVTFLGTKEPFYEFMRRFGIYFYFLGTALAQLFLAVSLRGICKGLRDRALSRMAAAMLILCLMPFALGVLNLAQKSLLPHETADALENSIEWIASLMMQVYFLVVFFAWRRTGLAVSVSVAAPRGDT
jgi:NADH:ubiquinone oxidoreductase subunit 6 (subunit J)